MIEDDDWPDEDQYEPRRYYDMKATAPTCKHCGAEDLEWVDIGMGRWRLYEGKKLHVCKATTDDFEVIE